LPEDSGVRLEAHTGIGNLRSEFPVLRGRRSGFLVGLGGRLSGDVGTGGTTSTLRLQTGVGNVTIRRAQAAGGPRPAESTPPDVSAETAPAPQAQPAPPTRSDILDRLNRGEIDAQQALALLRRAASPARGA
jgi:hypothetical protein